MIIIDASIATKLFLPNEPGFSKVKGIFRLHSESIEKIIIPELLFYEVANALTTKTDVPEIKTVKAINQLAKYNLGLIRPSLEIIIKTVSFAKKYHVSVYDSVYAILAKENGCNLITADKKFVKQVNLPFVKTLSSLPKL